MKYLKICDTEAQANELAYALKQVGKAYRRFGELTQQEVTGPQPCDYVRGQSRLHYEYDAIYLKVEDERLSIYLSCLTDFDGRWRLPGQVRIFETV